MGDPTLSIPLPTSETIPIRQAVPPPPGCYPATLETMFEDRERDLRRRRRI